MSESPNSLNLPDVEAVEFERNFIKTAVCELRFPTLLEFETKPPTQLQKVLRKEYPLYEHGQAVSVGPDDVKKEVRYLFRSKKKNWLVSFKSFAIALETSHYTNFEEFARRLEDVLTKSQPLIDSDFFTRVGLRYIDEIPIEDNEVSGWINEDLVAPLAKGVYGTVERSLQVISGSTRSGSYTFRHGIAGLDQGGHQIYKLDFDFHKENVESESVLSLVSEFNRESFRFFSWAIGPKALERLGKVLKKTRE